MLVLVINSGSSSIKFQLLQMKDESLQLSGLLERIGENQAELSLSLGDGATRRERVDAGSHEQGMMLILDALKASQLQPESQPLSAIGHRVVHGGEAFSAPVLLDDVSIERIRD